MYRLQNLLCLTRPHLVITVWTLGKS